MADRERNGLRTTAGFSLTELVIVLALAGILLSLAVPGYRGFILRAHRVEIIVQMLQIAACQERVYSAHMAYDTSRCLPPPGTRYRMEYSDPGDAGGTAYTILATPLGPQADDSCGALLLNHNGGRSVDGAQADPDKCWAGR